MNKKSDSLAESHPEDVATLKKYVRGIKAAFFVLIFAIFVNFVLMYGLIFGPPCTPNVSRCMQFCPTVNPIRTISDRHDDVISILPTISNEHSSQEKPRVVTTDIAVRSTLTEVGDHLDPRVYLWFWVVMSAYYVANQAVAWWNMVSACHDFSDASNIINCVWGAVSTVITAGGAFWGAYQTVGHVQTWFNNNGVTFGGWKRDSIDSGLLEDFSTLLGGPVEHLGAFDYAALGLNGTLSTRQSTEPVDVFGFTSPDGLSMHFSYLGNTTNGLAFKFGFGPGTTSPPLNSTLSNITSSTIQQRANFNQQYFTWGGIDFLLLENSGDGGTLSVSNDYGQIDHEVSCLMSPDMSAAGHWFQVYDANHHGTIVEGAVAPFRGDDHWSAISVMQNVPVPLASVQSCEVSKQRRAIQFDA